MLSMIVSTFVPEFISVLILLPTFSPSLLDRDALRLLLSALVGSFWEFVALLGPNRQFQHRQTTVATHAIISSVICVAPSNSLFTRKRHLFVFIQLYIDPILIYTRN